MKGQEQEGVVRFSYDTEVKPPISSALTTQLINMRNRIHQLGWIGVDVQGVGFGNISVRVQANDTAFLITASQTGHLPQIEVEHLCLITDFNLNQYSLTCVGTMAPSSESLTHATLYACDSNIHAVIHIHHPAYDQLLEAPITIFDSIIEYGTPELSKAIILAYERTDLPSHRLLISKGHSGGIYAFGHSLEEAFETIHNWLDYVCY